jgi:hypothetical protein
MYPWVQLVDYQLPTKNSAPWCYYRYDIHIYDKLFTYYPL